MERTFTPFAKIARLKKEATASEKLDGTCACVAVTDEGDIFAQSRNKIITPNDDNAGFAKWVDANKEALKEQLGPGTHFGEWWGQGIGRNYGLKEKRFSLFNTYRWHTESDDYRCIEAPLCFVVPTLAILEKFSTERIDELMEQLKEHGSYAADGYTSPEGLVVHHSASGTLFKCTFEFDSGKWSDK